MLLPYPPIRFLTRALTNKPLGVRCFWIILPDYAWQRHAISIWVPTSLGGTDLSGHEMDTDGNDLRNGIYLPEGTWMNYFQRRCVRRQSDD